jgi:putative tryptophan/tyrosine transport system substrate-binding protein
MTNRVPKRAALSVTLLVLVTFAACRSQSPKVPQVTIVNLLSHPILNDSIAGIRKGLADAGYAEGQLRIVELSANGEMGKLNALAREALSGRPDVIVPVSTPVAQAVLREADDRQPIVFSTVTNPDDLGGPRQANVTGVSDAVNYEANLALIRELVPTAKRIGVVYNPSEANSQFGVSELQRLLVGRTETLQVVPIARSEQVPDAARSLLGSVDVLYVGSDNTVVGAIAGLVKVAEERRIPVIASDSGSVEDGALAAVSVNYVELGRRVGAIVAQILRTGTSAGSIQNEFFRGDALLLNKKAAVRIGFAFPQATVERAARVIE